MPIVSRVETEPEGRGQASSHPSAAAGAAHHICTLPLGSGSGECSWRCFRLSQYRDRVVTTGKLADQFLNSTRNYSARASHSATGFRSVPELDTDSDNSRLLSPVW